MGAPGQTTHTFGRRATLPVDAAPAADDPRLLALAEEARRLAGERSSAEFRAYKAERDSFFASYRVPALLLMLLAPLLTWALHLSGWWALAADSGSFIALFVRRRGRKLWLRKVGAA